MQSHYPGWDRGLSSGASPGCIRRAFVLQSSKPEIQLLNHVQCKKEGKWRGSLGESEWVSGGEGVGEGSEGVGVKSRVCNTFGVCVCACVHIYVFWQWVLLPSMWVCVCVYAVVTQWPDIKYLFRPSFHLPKVLHALFQGAPFPHSAEARLWMKAGKHKSGHQGMEGRQRKKKKRRAENAAHHLVVCIDCSQMGDRWKGFRSEGG